MTNENQLAAEQAAFRSFANSYIREIDAGRPVFHWIDAQNVDCVELPLPARGVTLRLEMLSRSLCGMHRYGRIWTRHDMTARWREVEPIFAVNLMILAAGSAGKARMRGAELEMLERVLLSYDAMRCYLDDAAIHPSGRPTFIAAEQSLYYGHPLHPTPKSLQGMTDWHQRAYAPEFRNAFQLAWFSADAALLRCDSAGGSVEKIVHALLRADAGDLAIDGAHRLLPMHPLQAEALLLDPAIRSLIETGQLRHLGAAGPSFTATSSVRTLYSDGVPWMPKFSLPVRITNSRRVNKRHELHDAVAVSRFFARAGLNEFHPRLRFMHDSAYLTLDLPGKAESGFEVLFRDGSVIQRGDDQIVTVSALTAEPLPGGLSAFVALIERIAHDTRLSPRDACHRWFSAYLDCVLDPMFHLYDRFGVALEAHQQNSLLDLSNGGFPTRLIYRDSQGFYLSSRFRSRWCGLTPDLASTQNVFFDDRVIQERFAYYLVVNQIFAVIARASHDRLATEAELLGLLRFRLRRLALELCDGGRELASLLLNRPHIAAKANLITRLRDLDELASEGGALYTHFPNPLSTVGMAIASEDLHAIAS